MPLFSHHQPSIAFRIGLWLLLCFWSVQGFAWNSITLLTTNDTPAVNEFISSLKQEISSLQGVKIILAKNDSGLTINIPKDTLVVAVGTQALKFASNLDERTPVLGVLVPKMSYENILHESQRQPSRFSAVYLDQPFERQFSMIKAIFPYINRIGVLLGPISQFQSNDLQNAAKKYNIEVDISLVEKSDQLHDSLERITMGKQVLLAIPDPLIYTRDTAQTILLTTYHRQAPVIGFSKSYVQSGAIAAVFSTPKQYAQEVADVIKSEPRDFVSFPSAHPAKAFSVEINRQVAKSLELILPSEAEVSRQMLENEK